MCCLAEFGGQELDEKGCIFHLGNMKQNTVHDFMSVLQPVEKTYKTHTTSSQLSGL